jgi:hypothetical protein
MRLGCGDCRRVACVDTEPVRRCVAEQQREPNRNPGGGIPVQGYDHVVAKQGSRCSQPSASGMQQQTSPHPESLSIPHAGQRSANHVRAPMIGACNVG